MYKQTLNYNYTPLGLNYTPIMKPLSILTRPTQDEENARRNVKTAME